jgi:hypothetical protein
MKKPSPLLLIGVRYGAVAAVLSVSLMVAMFYLGRHPLMVAPFMDFRILLYGVFIFFSLKEFREYHQEGVLYFWQGMVGSFVVVATAAVIGSLILRVFISLEDNFIPEYVSVMTEYLRGFPEEEINRIGKDAYDRNLEGLPATTSAQIATLYLAQSFGIGLFISIILSVILRKQPNPV